METMRKRVAKAIASRRVDEQSDAAVEEMAQLLIDAGDVDCVLDALHGPSEAMEFVGHQQAVECIEGGCTMAGKHVWAQMLDAAIAERS
jgi:hypothetical protein